MERIEALKELAAKVEAGEVGFEGFCPLWHDSGLCLEAEGAYHGSLDAAKALHEAVLPGWLWVCGADSDGPFAYVNEFPGEEMEMAVCDETRCADAARSLLLAILRALIAKEGE